MLANRILVLSAQLETGLWMSDMLGLEGDMVDAVTDGAEAFQRVWGTEYDVIVAELGVPGVDGRDLFMALQNTWPELTRRMVFFATTPTPAQERFVVRNGVIMLRGALSLVELRDAIRTVRTLPRAAAIA